MTPRELAALAAKRAGGTRQAGFPRTPSSENRP
jgi:hypothetical protein